MGCSERVWVDAERGAECEFGTDATGDFGAGRGDCAERGPGGVGWDRGSVGKVSRANVPILALECASVVDAVRERVHRGHGGRVAVHFGDDAVLEEAGQDTGGVINRMEWYHIMIC